ncbi:tetraacyldisaccharide 4'-kinase [Thermosulfuriphilus ammonigenes]|uniref:Tetraacyldisaccharide 4'-kinase n=1 Tax=Thermosulfuriphilus ammonigenes TaxID=1936021 RepID=A0A6G7PY52_9BACT|nr:tetraacyldisaccharide 4'-kinase [Thermosulfuriphilus ammonigenes]MBA2849298.1 tetraacyldisaccharide 4'-kinase [Thermosulfuriphilus ammonigenes]QIJ72378.1 tetraacyldisaccharide 4'-kinase [Thermosulfuriphilus ammonigenes]
MSPLHLLGRLYGRLMTIRANLYRRGFLRSYTLPVPVISVGNLSLGGTGKTPFTLWLARFLIRFGHRPVILSRGYRRRGRGTVVVSTGSGPLVTPELAGDEPHLLASRLSGALVVVDKDRYRAGALAISRLSASIALLDDGFQHLRLKRDLDIVLVSPETDPRREAIFPAGRLREPPAALSRADALIITKANLFPEEKVRGLEDYLASFGLPVFKLNYRVEGLYDLSGDPVAWPEPPWGAFCGLAQPSAFFALLESEGQKPAFRLSFPDHHRYSSRDLVRLGRALQQKGLRALITTEKDAVKLRSFEPELPIFCLRLDLEVAKDLEGFIIEKLKGLS